MKKKILMFTDSPNAPTGFGQVSKHLLEVLTDFNIEMVALNCDGREMNNGSLVFHAMEGWNNAIDWLIMLIQKGDFDILFVAYDCEIAQILKPYVAKAKKDHKFTYIQYAPIDQSIRTQAHQDWYKTADIPVFYDQRSAKLVTDDLDVKIIPHGCDPEMFHRLPDDKLPDIRKKWGTENKFIVLNVNHNQWRKDIGSSIRAFLKFAKKHPNSLYIIHAVVDDMGGNLTEQIDNIALLEGWDLQKMADKIIVTNQSRFKFGQDQLNELYNIADCFLTTSMGEGWGLTTTEAMAVGMPIIAPRNTSFEEILANGRGILCNNIDWVIPYANRNIPYPKVDIDDVAKALKSVYDMKKGDHDLMIQKQHDWVINNTWKKSQELWRKLFDKVKRELTEVI